MTLMTQQREMGKVTATRRRETTVRMKEVRLEASSQSNIAITCQIWRTGSGMLPSSVSPGLLA